MIVALTGPSGFLGSRLIARLQAEGHTVRALGRRDPAKPDVQFVRWESTSVAPPSEALTGVDAVIHLAGEPVAQRWNSEVKKKIRDSRVLGTRHLVNTIGKLKKIPPVLVAASAIGFYGDRGDEILNENSAPGSDFLSQTCVEWERESRQAEEFGVRVAMLRFGIVLGAEGGALKQMVPPFKAGVGGPVGSGKQWVSWIHADDAVGLLLFALLNQRVSGVVNATAPAPVRNAEFASAMGHALSRPSLIPTPAFALKLLFGELAGVLLASQRVTPAAAQRAGFAFRYQEIGATLNQILS